MGSFNAPRHTQRRQTDDTVDRNAGSAKAAHPARILQRASEQPSALTAADVMTLQRTIGNQATIGVLQRTLGIQPKLRLGPADDAYEQEADRVAQQVVQRIHRPPVQRQEEESRGESQPFGISTPAPSPVPVQRFTRAMARPKVQRQTEDEELQLKPLPAPARSKITFVKPTIQRQDEEDELAQLKPMHGPEGGAVKGSVERQIASARGGKTLDAGVRRSMEGAFGADFGGVRVHTGSQADTLNRSLNARAFTAGRDIFFRRGEYNPGSAGGQKLLAHELTHTVQQGAAGVQRTLFAPPNVIQATLTDEVFSNFSTRAAKISNKKDARRTGLRKTAFRKVKEGLEIYVKQHAGKSNKWKKEKLEYILGAIDRWLADSDHQKDTSVDGIARREAMHWLQPRLKAEWAAVTSITSQDQTKNQPGLKDAKGGMTSVVLGINYKDKIGFSKTNKGVFKVPPTSFTGADAPAGYDAGIDTENPMFKNRAIASTVLANLFDSSVIAQTLTGEFKGRQGYVMEQAEGVEPRGSKWNLIDDENEIESAKSDIDAGFDDVYKFEGGSYYKLDQEIPNPINWGDVSLQEQLVELQLLDVIMGQVDRHAANYLVKQGPGSTQVKGIDPDLSFGKNKTSAKMTRQVGNTVKSDDKSMDQLPPIVTQSTFNRIMAIRPEDVRNALSGLLSGLEVAAAEQRLQDVQTHLGNLQSNGRVVDHFDSSHAALLTDKNSYWKRDKKWHKGESQKRGL
ncbi:MAG: DUF4157 domain-containing protein [Caldilineaceae bacterium]|nr:DUF4157 domain-containing protein [Caldilineaceae bacterium]